MMDRSSAVVRICAGLLFAASAMSAELPEDAAKLIASFDKKRHDLEAKASTEVAKEQEVLIKTLLKLQDRETKARHSEAALAIKDKLEELGSAPVVVKAKGKTFADFLASVEAQSSTYQNKDGQVITGITRIKVGETYTKIAVGLNVVAVVDGEQVLERTYHSAGDFDAFIKDMDALPQGAFLVMAVMNEVSHTLPEACDKTFRSLGAGQGLYNQGGDIAYVLISAKGMKPGGGVELLSRDHVEYPPPKKK
jgi:hypothetical protein